MGTVPADCQSHGLRSDVLPPSSDGNRSLISAAADYLLTFSTSTTLWPTAGCMIMSMRKMFLSPTAMKSHPSTQSWEAHHAPSLLISTGNWGPNLAAVVIARLTSHVGAFPVKLIRLDTSWKSTPYQMRTVILWLADAQPPIRIRPFPALYCFEAAEHRCNGMPLETALSF